MNPPVSISLVTAEALRKEPQRCEVITADFETIAHIIIGRPFHTHRQDKKAKWLAGAWLPVALSTNLVKGGNGPSQLIAGDVDCCGPDGFARTCAALSEYCGFVYTSCNATPTDM